MTSSIIRVSSRRITSWTRRAGLEVRMLDRDLAQDLAQQRHTGQFVDVKNIGAQPVVDVVGIVGNIVGDSAALRLGARIAPQPQIVAVRILRDGARQAALAVARSGVAVAVGQRPVVLDQAFQRLPGEVEPVELGIAPLQRRHDMQRLGVVVEAAKVRQATIERALAGVTERRVSEVVAERAGLGQILVEREGAGERAGDLRDLESVRQAGAEMIALVKHEHLRLVGEAPEGRGVDDAVAVAAEVAARRTWRLPIEPAAAAGRIGRKRRTGERCDAPWIPLDWF